MSVFGGTTRAKPASGQHEDTPGRLRVVQLRASVGRRPEAESEKGGSMYIGIGTVLLIILIVLIIIFLF